MKQRWTGRIVAAIIPVVVLAGSTTGCNHRSPLPDAVGTIGPSATQVVAPIALFGISINPPGLLGSTPATGTAILTRQAQDDVVVALSSSDSSGASVPPTVTVPRGTDRATFPIATQTVSSDRQVVIAGSGQGSLATAPLQVWAITPTFFLWFSDPGDGLGKGGFGRLTPTNATITATGSDAGVVVRVQGAGTEFWLLNFAPPRNTKLLVAPYEDAMRFADAVHPGMEIDGRGIGCSTLGGRFDVRELVVTVSPSATTVSRFDATFEQHCENIEPALRGEVKYVASAAH